MISRVIHRKVGTEGLLKQDCYIVKTEQPYTLKRTKSSRAHIKERLA